MSKIQIIKGRPVDMSIIYELAEVDDPTTSEYYIRVSEFLERAQSDTYNLSSGQEAWLTKIVDTYEDQYSKTVLKI